MLPAKLKQAGAPTDDTTATRTPSASQRRRITARPSPSATSNAPSHTSAIAGLTLTVKTARAGATGKLSPARHKRRSHRSGSRARSGSYQSVDDWRCLARSLFFTSRYEIATPNHYCSWYARSTRLREQVDHPYWGSNELSTAYPSSPRSKCHCWIACRAMEQWIGLDESRSQAIRLISLLEDRMKARLRCFCTLPAATPWPLPSLLAQSGHEEPADARRVCRINGVAPLPDAGFVYRRIL